MANQQTYGAKLLDPRWRDLKEIILQRDNRTCRLCGDQTNVLHVHHEDYNGNPWDISNNLLNTVCLHCHAVIHKLPDHKILAISKRIYLNAKCWEVVAFTEKIPIFLYLFFDTNCHTDKTEIITLFPYEYKKSA